MNHEKANQFLRKAFEYLHIAEHEIMRPAEDTVTLCACQCIRIAASEFLHSYLLSNSNEVSSGKCLSELLHQCSKIDSHFNAIDLSCFECRNTDSNQYDKNYCLSVEKVNECFEKTHVIRELVMAKLNLLEKDFQ